MVKPQRVTGLHIERLAETAPSPQDNPKNTGITPGTNACVGRTPLRRRQRPVHLKAQLFASTVHSSFHTFLGKFACDHGIDHAKRWIRKRDRRRYGIEKPGGLYCEDDNNNKKHHSKTTTTLPRLLRVFPRATPAGGLLFFLGSFTLQPFPPLPGGFRLPAGATLSLAVAAAGCRPLLPWLDSQAGGPERGRGWRRASFLGPAVPVNGAIGT